MSGPYHTRYLSKVFNPFLFQEIVKLTLDKARQLQKELEFDTIAFSGMSGSAMAFILANELNCTLLAVRREKEASHFVSGSRNEVVEGFYDANKYLIVDDFISSGDTIRRIASKIHGVNKLSECVGILLYSDTRGYSSEVSLPYHKDGVKLYRPAMLDIEDAPYSYPLQRGMNNPLQVGIP